MTGEVSGVHIAESLALLAVFSSGALFTIAAAFAPRATPRPQETPLQAPHGRPVIGAPPEWKP